MRHFALQDDSKNSAQKSWKVFSSHVRIWGWQTWLLAERICQPDIEFRSLEIPNVVVFALDVRFSIFVNFQCILCLICQVTDSFFDAHVLLRRFCRSPMVALYLRFGEVVL